MLSFCVDESAPFGESCRFACTGAPVLRAFGRSSLQLHIIDMCFARTGAGTATWQPRPQPQKSHSQSDRYPGATATATREPQPQPQIPGSQGHRATEPQRHSHSHRHTGATATATGTRQPQPQPHGSRFGFGIFMVARRWPPSHNGHRHMSPSQNPRYTKVYCCFKSSQNVLLREVA